MATIQRRDRGHLSLVQGQPTTSLLEGTALPEKAPTTLDHPHQPRGGNIISSPNVRRWGVPVLAATAVVALSFVANSAADRGNENQHNTIEQEALRSASTGWKGRVLVLRKGARTRKAPQLGDLDGDSTFASRVEKGVKKIVEPVVFEEQTTFNPDGSRKPGTDTWVAFINTDDTASTATNPEWVNVTEMARQEKKTGHNYFDVYTVAGATTSSTYSVEVQDGKFMDDGRVVAVGSDMSEKEFASSVTAEELSLAPAA